MPAPLINRVLILFKAADRLLQVLVPPSPKQLCYLSSPDYGDSSYYIYHRALRTRTGLDHVWLLTDMSVADRIRRDFAQAAQETGQRGHSLSVLRRASLHGYWAFLRSGRTFHTHGVYRFVSWAFRRAIVCLWHGMPIKRVGRLNRVSTNPFPTFGTRHVASSHFFKYVVANAFDAPADSVLVSGLPRDDALTGRAIAPKATLQVRQRLGLPAGRKLILWMPTFRVDASDAAPVWRSFLDDIPGDLLAALDRACARHACEVLIKLHPYDHLNRSNDLACGSHIRVLRASEWQAFGIQLYELVAEADALISDVSSIIIDYLVTGRPIGICGFDSSAYRRGLTFPIKRLLASRRFAHLDSPAAVTAFVASLGQPRDVAANDVAALFYEDPGRSSADIILDAVGLPAR